MSYHPRDTYHEGNKRVEGKNEEEEKGEGVGI